jgi:hypothetical protein
LNRSFQVSNLAELIILAKKQDLFSNDSEDAKDHKERMNQALQLKKNR